MSAKPDTPEPEGTASAEGQEQTTAAEETAAAFGPSAISDHRPISVQMVTRTP